jgi:hypothetical protein
MRLKLIAVTLLCWSALLAVPALAQNVSCGNGYYCPPLNACLLNGLCGRLVDRLPGSSKTSTGEWCEPGLREHQYEKGRCTPTSYVDCPSGNSCPPGYTCGSDGKCQGGPPAMGPMCGGGQCAQGRVCSSNNTCMNPDFMKDCGNGQLCSKHATCEYPKGCALVAPQHTKQFR